MFDGVLNTPRANIIGMQIERDKGGETMINFGYKLGTLSRSKACKSK